MAGSKRRGKGRPFAKGHDPRRHELTTEERQRGYVNAFWRCAAESLDRAAWLHTKVRRHYGFNAAGEENKNPPNIHLEDAWLAAQRPDGNEDDFVQGELFE